MIDLTSIQQAKESVKISSVWTDLSLPGSPSKSCRSPWRRDHHPSFSVFDEGRRWKDFSTGESGDVIDFVQTSLQIPCGQALQWVYERAGIHEIKKDLSPADIFEAKQRHRELKSKAKAREYALMLEQQTIGLVAAHINERIRTFDRQDWRECRRLSEPHIDRVEAQYLFLKHMFHPDDLLWLGMPRDTGSPHHVSHFKTRDQWLSEELLPTRIAPGTYKNGVHSRSGRNILTQPYIVVESDCMLGFEPTSAADKELNKRMTYALVQVLEEDFGMTLRAIVDTGNKSLHCWFETPPQEDLEKLILVSDSIGIDKGLLKVCASAPLRLPKGVHEKSNQPSRLLYLQGAPRTESIAAHKTSHNAPF